MQCTLCIMQIAVCIRQCVVCNVLCAVFSMQCVQCVVCGVHAVFGAVFAVHFVVSIGLGWCGMGGGGQIGLATLRELNCFLHDIFSSSMDSGMMRITNTNTNLNEIQL